jgi:hypothetical protein
VSVNNNTGAGIQARSVYWSGRGGCDRGAEVGGAVGVTRSDRVWLGPPVPLLLYGAEARVAEADILIPGRSSIVDL